MERAFPLVLGRAHGVLLHVPQKRPPGPKFSAAYRHESLHRNISPGEPPRKRCGRFVRRHPSSQPPTTKRTTTTMNDSIGLYLNDIGKVSLLNAEEERELSRVI